MEKEVEQYEKEVGSKWGEVVSKMAVVEEQMGEREELLKDVQHYRKIFGKTIEIKVIVIVFYRVTGDN